MVYLFNKYGCITNTCNNKLANKLKKLKKVLKKSHPTFTLVLFGKNESLIQDLSIYHDIGGPDDIIHLYRGNKQLAWTNLPKSVKNKANYINYFIPNKGNPHTNGGCAGTYVNGILAETSKIPLNFGKHTLVLLRSNLISYLFNAGYGIRATKYGSVGKYYWKVNCVNFKLPIFENGNNVVTTDPLQISSTNLRSYVKNYINGDSPVPADSSGNIIPIGDWDVSGVKYTRFTFYNGKDLYHGITIDTSDFNDDISNWDTSNVTSMSYMFGGQYKDNTPEKKTIGATSFNQDLSWNTLKVKIMDSMFNGATAFNGDISNWNVSNVTDMESMFGAATDFNSDISNWDVSKVTNMQFMFVNATTFNQDIGNWDTSNVTDLSFTFSNASSFNQDLSWNTVKTLNMAGTFQTASAFNGNISNWDTSIVTSMGSMFSFAVNFNQNISSWDVSSVTGMSSMFYSAIVFNQNISGWDVSSVTNYGYFSTNSGLTVTNIPSFS